MSGCFVLPYINNLFQENKCDHDIGLIIEMIKSIRFATDINHVKIYCILFFYMKTCNINNI